MSRRFGRNQRRRMREQVASLAKSVEMDRALLSDQGRRIGSLNDEIDRAKRMVGPNSALFEPGSISTQGGARSHMRAPVRTRMDFTAVMEQDAIVAQTMRDVPLDVLLASVEDDRFEDRQHFRVKFGDGQWGYAISRPAVHSMPKRDLVSMLARELAFVIANALKVEPS